MRPLVYNEREVFEGRNYMKKLFKHKTATILFCVFASFFLLAVMFLFAVNVIMWGSVKERIVDVDNAAALDTDFDCILVLGAGVRPNGSPSAMLEDRLEIGIELYFADASDRLLMSGDHMSADYDEVGVMKRHATDAGVPSNVIFLDHAGLSTYESMWRAKELYGAEKVLVVTQKYHLYRALYVAQALGLDAYGVSADLRPYSGQSIREVREIAARVKDFFFVIAKPKPTYLGDSVDLSGDGDSTNVNKLLPGEECPIGIAEREILPLL